jgi:hypothetical protein
MRSLLLPCHENKNETNPEIEHRRASVILFGSFRVAYWLRHDPMPLTVPAE